MRKSGIITALAVVLSSFTPMYAGAMTDDEAYAYQPSAYFRVESSNFEVLKNGSIYIKKDKLTENNTLKVSSMYRDDSLFSKTVILRVAGSDTDNIRLGNIVNPFDIGETQAYNQSKELYSFAFDVVEDDILISVNCNTGLMSQKRLVPSGSATDDYPFALFDAVISPDIPVGNYDIHYILKSDVTDGGSMYSQVSFQYDDPTKISGKYNLETSNLSIHVSEKDLGHINEDDAVNAIDASQIMADYSSLSSSSAPVLDDNSRIAGDVNGDGAVNSIDASLIMSYYSYASTIPEGQEAVSLSEYISQNI